MQSGWKWCRSDLGVKVGTSRLGLALELFPLLVSPALCWRMRCPIALFPVPIMSVSSENQSLFWFVRKSAFLSIFLFDLGGS